MERALAFIINSFLFQLLVGVLFWMEGTQYLQLDRSYPKERVHPTRYGLGKDSFRDSVTDQPLPCGVVPAYVLWNPL